MEDWCDRLRRDPTPEKMMRYLISDMSILDKSAVLDVFLEASFQKGYLKMTESNKSKETKENEERKESRSHNMLCLESKLQDGGNAEVAQFICFCISAHVAFDEEEEEQKEKKREMIRNKRKRTRRTKS